MVDVLGPAAAHGTIYCPIVIQSEEVGLWSQAAPPGFPPADPLPRVFDNLPARRNRLGRVDSVPMDRRLAQNHTEASVMRIDCRALELKGRWHNLVGIDFTHYNGIL